MNIILNHAGYLLCQMLDFNFSQKLVEFPPKKSCTSFVNFYSWVWDFWKLSFWKFYILLVLAYILCALMYPATLLNVLIPNLSLDPFWLWTCKPWVWIIKAWKGSSWQNLMMTYGWLFFFGVDAPHFLYPFITWWALRLLPFVGYWDRIVVPRDCEE